jgi:hypothetical protein
MTRKNILQWYAISRVPRPSGWNLTRGWNQLFKYQIHAGRLMGTSGTGFAPLTSLTSCIIQTVSWAINLSVECPTHLFEGVKSQEARGNTLLRT